MTTKIIVTVDKLASLGSNSDFLSPTCVQDLPASDMRDLPYFRNNVRAAGKIFMA